MSKHACTENTPGQVAIQLHHAALPKLADAGLLDYDAAEQTVEYIGHPLVEDCLDLVDAEQAHGFLTRINENRAYVEASQLLVSGRDM